MAVLAYKGVFFRILVLCNGTQNLKRREKSNFPRSFSIINSFCPSCKPSRKLYGKVIDNSSSFELLA